MWFLTPPFSYKQNSVYDLNSTSTPSPFLTLIISLRIFRPNDVKRNYPSGKLLMLRSIVLRNVRFSPTPYCKGISVFHPNRLVNTSKVSVFDFAVDTDIAYFRSQPCSPRIRSFIIRRTGPKQRLLSTNSEPYPNDGDIISAYKYRRVNIDSIKIYIVFAGCFSVLSLLVTYVQGTDYNKICNFA